MILPWPVLFVTLLCSYFIPELVYATSRHCSRALRTSLFPLCADSNRLVPERSFSAFLAPPCRILAPATYVFFASILPAVAFGEQLAQNTDGALTVVQVYRAYQRDWSTYDAAHSTLLDLRLGLRKRSV